MSEDVETPWRLLGIIPAFPPPGFSAVFNAETDEVWVVKLAGKLLALSNVCPHKLGPLAEGDISDGKVECPWHGYVFNLATGQCINHSSCPHLYHYDLRTEPDGRIFIRERKYEILPRLGADKA